jgi:hypothetical protein
VQVDDEKRPDDAVPEHVREPARLKDPNVSRKLRIQAAKVGARTAREPNGTESAKRRR